jgi:hypothetical protein
MFDGILASSVDTAPTSLDAELKQQKSLVRKKSAGGMVEDMSTPIVTSLVR